MKKLSLLMLITLLMFSVGVNAVWIEIFSDDFNDGISGNWSNHSVDTCTTWVESGGYMNMNMASGCSYTGGNNRLTLSDVIDGYNSSWKLKAEILLKSDNVYTNRPVIAYGFTDSLLNDDGYYGNDINNLNFGLTESTTDVYMVGGYVLASLNKNAWFNATLIWDYPNDGAIGCFNQSGTTSQTCYDDYNNSGYYIEPNYFYFQGQSRGLAVNNDYDNVKIYRWGGSRTNEYY